MMKRLSLIGIPLLSMAPTTVFACDLDGFGGMHRFAAFAALQAQAQQDTEALPRPDRRSLPSVQPQTEQFDAPVPDQAAPSDNDPDGQPVPDDIQYLSVSS